MELRDYQTRIANESADILNRFKLVCIFAEVRTGKSLMALQTCENVKAKSVLFITKIKAFSSIKWDYDQMDYNFSLTIINRESLHKIETNDFDVVIIDEVHGYTHTLSRQNITKILKTLRNIPMIMLSGNYWESFSILPLVYAINHPPKSQ